MYGTEPRFNEILVITNTIQKRNRKLYLIITNKCEHLKKDESQTEPTRIKISVHSSFKQFCLPCLEFLLQLGTEALLHTLNCSDPRMLGLVN